MISSDIRLIAWNCQHGLLETRLAELACYAPAIVFLQECRSVGGSALRNRFVTRTPNPQKCIALGSLGGAYRLVRLRRRANGGEAVVAARVAGPVSFTALGVWSRGPHYVDDVLKSVHVYRNVLRAGPAVVMGDLNSGTNLAGRQSSTRGHLRIVNALADLGLVSAYHAFYHLEQGHESHPTYLHQRNPSKPWHIDFCFVPAGWVQSLVCVEVLDGRRWRATSDHLPIKVDVSLAKARQSYQPPRRRSMLEPCSRLEVAPGPSKTTRSAWEKAPGVPSRTARR